MTGMKPILFNTDMVRALLENHKTVTRRVVKPQQLRVLDSPYHKEHPETPDKVLLEKLCEPPYRPGDILYVRETFCPYEKDHIINGVKYAYKADATTESERARRAFGYKWRPSIHMPREAARIFLRVTGVRVEKLKSMLPCDIQNEGCPYTYSGFDEEQDPDWYGWMESVWNSTIKPADRALYGWDVNPWVFVISFERISKDETLQ